MKKTYEVIGEILGSKPGVKIKLLGDSITHGAGGTGFEQNGYAFISGFARNPDGHCYANNFKRFMEEKFDCTVTNNACTGTTIEFILSNFDTLVDKDDDLVICAIGTNNRHVYFGATPGERPTREEIGTGFYNNVIKLSKMFRDAGKAVIFVANIPASVENEQDGGDYWRILHMDDINAIYKKAAEKVGFPLISFYDLVTEYCAANNITVDDLLADGLHPNDRGYDVMCDLLLAELRLK